MRFVEAHNDDFSNKYLSQGNHDYFQLMQFIRLHNDLPKYLTLSGRKQNEPTNILYGGDVTPQDCTANALGNSYIKNFVETIHYQTEKLKNVSLKQMITYVNKVLPNLTNELANCTIKATIDPINLQFQNTVEVTLTIPCHGNKNNIALSYVRPIKVLIPIADYIDELIIHSSDYNVRRVFAKMNLSIDELDFLFEHPIFDIHEETEKQWYNVFSKVHRSVLAFHGTKIAIPCVNGQLQKPLPLEMRGPQTYFDGYDKPSVGVYKVENKKGDLK